MCFSFYLKNKQLKNVTIKIAIQTVKQSFLYISHSVYCNVNVVIVLQCFVLNRNKITAI